MRDNELNNIDNLSQKLDSKINKMIQHSLNSKNDIEDKGPKKQRIGLLGFGAFQMSNVKSFDYALFGISSSTVVGA